MNINTLIASKIKDIRKDSGLTSESVANDLGISKTAYSQLENGRVEITMTRLEAIANVFNVPITEILPKPNNINQISNGSGDNFNSHNNTVNNFFTPKEKERIDEISELMVKLSEEIKKISKIDKH